MYGISGYWKNRKRKRISECKVYCSNRKSKNQTKGAGTVRNVGTFCRFADSSGSEEEYQKYTKPIIEKINDNKRIYPGHGTYFKFIEWKNGGIKNEQ